jgi:hypothetical protein
MKENKQSRLTITEFAGERQVQDIFTGEITNQKMVKKYVADTEVSLGSIKIPNKLIKEIRYDVPMGQKDFFTGWKQ